MKTTLIVLILGAMAGASLASTKEGFAPLEVLNREGQLTISDGSSVYTFKKDGTFASGPMGISGRTIEGKWTSPEAKDPGQMAVHFVVDGKWAWVNGMSPNDDFRTMTIVVYTGYFEELSPGMGPRQDPTILKFYKCYFLIEELKKKS